ncbi:uncharacterized protein SPAPADRAFT_66528 [Spathaspora passalidarum NRRL Y-27907]|uniref:Uncharacterized protein n=1 Tax=Spathaspora passalidarum (strain NRRL Y-27907 / 11-Y1) TaxID=619300 RepID=G3AKC7_SPAPN|nr:uncharacterized protein SPAPADRAFT_66528 [Spathaspora passalidarum NRRL Y-27907]EGW33586.1 hypothetical protein SPAPADRAFT_66528 [Spathaspora passalidarum NRRL Y-27907]
MASNNTKDSTAAKNTTNALTFTFRKRSHALALYNHLQVSMDSDEINAPSFPDYIMKELRYISQNRHNNQVNTDTAPIENGDHHAEERNNPSSLHQAPVPLELGTIANNVGRALLEKTTSREEIEHHEQKLVRKSGNRDRKRARLGKAFIGMVGVVDIANPINTFAKKKK